MRKLSLLRAAITTREGVLSYSTAAHEYRGYRRHLGRRAGKQGGSQLLHLRCAELDRALREMPGPNYAGMTFRYAVVGRETGGNGSSSACTSDSCSCSAVGGGGGAGGGAGGGWHAAEQGSRSSEDVLRDANWADVEEMLCFLRWLDLVMAHLRHTSNHPWHMQVVCMLVRTSTACIYALLASRTPAFA